MLGFIFGTACLIGLIWLLKSEARRRGGPFGHLGWHGGGCHGGWHGGPWAWQGRRGHWDGGIGQNPFLRHLFGRLDTTPGQEKAIRSAIEEFFSTAQGVKRSFWQARTHLAAVLRSEALDEGALSEVISRHDEGVDRLRAAAVDGLTKVYQALDARQRELLAQWLERGAERGAGSDGPYRTPPAAV